MKYNEHVIYDTTFDNEGYGLDDERGNLDKELDGCIVAFCDLGFWNGRKQGSHVYGSNLNTIFDVLQDSNYFYCDRYNVRSQLTHHDGTHFCLYRIAPTREAAQNICEKVAFGGMTEKQFRKATRSLRKYVADVYGW